MDMPLKPFFHYYGGKYRVASHYQQPAFRKIIEPFAGAAGYSVRHPHLEIHLYDKDAVVCGLWEYLIKVSSQEVLGLPLVIDHVDNVRACQEAKWLIGFWLNPATTSPRLRPGKWMRMGIRPNSKWGEAIRQRIACQVDSIRHWKIANLSYETIGNQEATWFVDPPYEGPCGKMYRCKLTDYGSLASWCKERQGQTIVCEKERAAWLPFLPFRRIRSTSGKNGKVYSNEVVWTNG